MKQEGWQNQVVYQIYPRSFCDSNGDGIGDIPGIISKLDYLADLGIDLIWLSPVYPSPNYDNGYDISDYCDINPEFGTLADFDQLLAEAKKRQIGIIMDLVINHTSNQHDWFQKSRQGIEPYKDFYIWKSAPDGKKPNNWTGFFGGDTWAYDEVRGQYYLHLFAKEQPDLNYHNPLVVEKVKEVMQFWLDRGVKGFRCDVINILYKDSLENGRWQPVLIGSEYYLSRPGLHKLLQEFNRDIWSPYGAYTVGETVFISPSLADDLTNPDRQELTSVFAFEHMETDCFGVKWFPRRFSPKRFFDCLSKWQKLPLWNTLYFENHDQPRSVSRFGDDQLYHKESAKALALLLLSLRGKPFLYQGQEIGMTNFDFESMDQVQDVESKNIWQIARKLHIPTSLCWKVVAKKSRDNARTPMQWTKEVGAGFSSNQAWLGINSNHREINVEDNLKSPLSIWHFYQRLLDFRKSSSILCQGNFQELYQKSGLFAFSRNYKGQGLIFLINLSSRAHKSPFSGPALFSSYEQADVTRELKPYEAALMDADQVRQNF